MNGETDVRMIQLTHPFFVIFKLIFDRLGDIICLMCGIFAQKQTVLKRSFGFAWHSAEAFLM